MQLKRRPPPPTRVNGTTPTVAAVLPSNKIAELVRQLAESRYETQQLRERMESLEHGKVLCPAAMGQKEKKEDISSALQPQEEQKKRESLGGSSAINREDTVVNERNCIEKPGFIDPLLSQLRKVQTPLPSSPDGMLLSSPPHSSAKVVARLSTNVADEVNGHMSYLGDSYWKKKYAKLKRNYKKALVERDLQLAEVQQLVFQLHEEHDELRHRHERDHLRQQLEIETKSRLLLEAKAKSLEEEISTWRRRVRRPLEEPAQTCNRVLAPEIGLPLDEAIDVGRHPHRQDGLNQTESSLNMSTALVSKFDAENLPQRDSQNVNTTEQRKGGAEQLLVGRWRQYRGEDICAVDPLGSHSVPLRPFNAMNRRSIAVQVEASTTTATSQTETCSQRSIGAQVDFVGHENDSERVGFPRYAKELELVQAVVKKAPITYGRGTTPPQSNVGDVPRCLLDVWASQSSQRKSLGDHLYYSVSGGRQEGNENMLSPRSSFLHELSKGPLYNTQPDTTALPSSSALGFGFAANGDDSKRQRIDEDIRKHDQLLEAVTKLQRRAQRAAKTPSLS